MSESYKILADWLKKMMKKPEPKEYNLKISDTSVKDLTQEEIEYAKSKNWHIDSGIGDPLAEEGEYD